MSVVDARVHTAQGIRDVALLTWLIVQAYSIPPGISNFRAHLGKGSSDCPLTLQLLVLTYVIACTAISVAPGGPWNSGLDHT